MTVLVETEKSAYIKGWTSQCFNTMKSNPFNLNSRLYKFWEYGWEDAKRLVSNYI